MGVLSASGVPRWCHKRPQSDGRVAGVESGGQKRWRGVKRSAAQRATDAERWVAARKAGVTVEAIAAADGVWVGTVVRATTDFGPFPGPPRELGRPSDPEFLTVDQVAAELAVGPHVVYRVIRKGGLPARRGVAGRHEVERLMFERWIADIYRQTREWITANPGTFARGSE